MSHYPATASTARMTYDTLGCFSTRLYMNRSHVQNVDTGTGTSPTADYTVTSTFTNPAVGDSVTLTISNSSGQSFYVGDHVVIGTRAAVLRTPPTISSTSTYDVMRMGGYDKGFDLTSFTLYMSDPDNDSNVTTSTTPDSSLGDARIGESQLFTVTNTTKVPANSFVYIGDHTGTYIITAAPSTTSITVKKVAAGDVPSGVSITSVPRISSGKLLAVIPRKPIFMQFVPTEMWYCCLKNSNSSTNTPVVSVGWNPNSESTRPAFSDNLTWAHGTTGTLGSIKPANSITAGKYGLIKDIETVTGSSANSLRRQAVPAGHALMACVHTETTLSMDYVIDLFVRGFYTRIPELERVGIRTL